MRRVQGKREDEGSNPEEVVEDFAMDWEVGERKRVVVGRAPEKSSGRERAEMSLRIERLERAMPLGMSRVRERRLEEANGLGGATPGG